MASSLTNSIILGVWATTFLSSFATTRSAADQSPFESEGIALVESGWWSSYSSDTSQRCNWPGISCNGAGSITEINLSGGKFIDVRDRFGKMNFSSFPNLVLLDLSDSELVGRIPPQIGDLSALKYLDLSGGWLSGELPPSLGNLTQLEFLDISYNRNINGSIPPQLGNLKNLVSLNLSWTSLTGEIPSFLGVLTNLRHLLLGGNPFSNQFDNGLNIIPQNLWNLRAPVTLKLYYCGIIGPIPSALGQLTNLKSLILWGNKINGSIPLEILYQLTNLETLYLDNNQLEGSLPQNIENLKNLRSLSVTNNSFTGQIPLALCRLTKLERIYLDENQINGSIPSCIGNLKALTFLVLSRNRLSGSIPPCIGSLSNLSALILDANLLDGPIPEEIGNLEALTSLDLSQNRLNGSIPSQIGNLNRLSYLNLSFNQLSGDIPVLSATYLKIVNARYGCSMIYPNPFEGNNHLSPYTCSPVTNQVNSKRILDSIKIFLAIAVFSTLFILGCLLFPRFRVKNNRVGTQPTKNGDLCSIWNYDGKIAYEDIIAATEDFDIRF